MKRTATENSSGDFTNTQELKQELRKMQQMQNRQQMQLKQQVLKKQP